MKIVANKKFISVLGNDFENKVFDTKRIYFGDLINYNIKEVDKCHYFDFQSPEGRFSPDLGDRTGNEAFFNKVQIEDYLAEGLASQEYLAQGIIFCFDLAKKLEKLEKKTFVIILSYEGEYTNITFHLKRHGENYIGDDIEKNLFPILIIKT